MGKWQKPSLPHRQVLEGWKTFLLVQMQMLAVWKKLATKHRSFPTPDAYSLILRAQRDLPPRVAKPSIECA